MRRIRSAVSMCVCVSLASSMVSMAPRVFAVGSEQDKAIATDLFDKGVAKMEKGKCDETPIGDVAACKEARENFRRAYELYPAALGALRNLAYVEKGLGMVASASRSFRELARKAPLDPKPERRLWADFAKDEVKALEPRIPHVIIKMPADKPAGTKVILDGAILAEGAWDTPIDVDPGKHVVHVEAPGRIAYDGSTTVAEKQTKTIAVVLEVDQHPVASDANKGPSKIPPLVVAGVGVAAIGVGLGLGYASMKKRDASCDANKLCDAQGLADGRSLANTSTVVTAIGGAALAAGVIWLILTPSSKEEKPATGTGFKATVTPYASVDGAGAFAIGRF